MWVFSLFFIFYNVHSHWLESIHVNVFVDRIILRFSSPSILLFHIIYLYCRTSYTRLFFFLGFFIAFSYCIYYLHFNVWVACIKRILFSFCFLLLEHWSEETKKKLTSITLHCVCCIRILHMHMLITVQMHLHCFTASPLKDFTNHSLKRNYFPSRT